MRRAEGTYSGEDKGYLLGHFGGGEDGHWAVDVGLEKGKGLGGETGVCC